ncbi:MAG: transposase domain-containing protein [Methylococcales bacterium]
MTLLSMQNTTPLFPGFHLQTLRKKPRSAQQILTDKVHQLKQKSFSQLSECLGTFIPEHFLQPAKSGEHSRQRLFSKHNTFWAFFSQILDADGGCKEVVRKFQAVSAMKEKTLPSSSTAAYCQARNKLSSDSLTSILKHTTEQLQAMSGAKKFHNRQLSLLMVRE